MVMSPVRVRHLAAAHPARAVSSPSDRFMSPVSAMLRTEPRSRPAVGNLRLVFSRSKTKDIQNVLDHSTAAPATRPTRSRLAEALAADLASSDAGSVPSSPSA
ncbi:hypothetical protein H9P43_000344 [Blastocladiella emersonii ATCC 22665]|nr:hypothetical protein H9P43_000344 [Blastocladiella emersonii ATCC 22665]